MNRHRVRKAVKAGKIKEKSKKNQSKILEAYYEY